jgi:hypothetical protein
MEAGEDDENFPVDLFVKIHKSSGNDINVYSFKGFKKHLEKQSLLDAFATWGAFDLSRPVVVRVLDEKVFVKSSWIFFLGPGSEVGEFEPVKESVRLLRRSNRDSSAHFANASENRFLPEDFEVFESTDSQLSNYLSALGNALVIAFLCDYTEISGGNVRYSLSGYKTISETVSFQELKKVFLSELQSIYKYVYLSGNYTDKIGLARNVISLHLKTQSICSVEDGTLSSVKSGYNLYLKDNVKQYIEIKNKLLEFLKDQSEKSSQVSRALFSSFKMKFWAFSTFFVSVFLLRSLQKTGESFIDERVIVPAVLLVIVSFVYLYIMIRESRFEKELIKERFDDMECRYKDLLDQKDLSSIIESKDNKSKIDQNIEGSISLYRSSWIVTSIIFLAILVVWWKLESGLDFCDLMGRIFK